MIRSIDLFVLWLSYGLPFVWLRFVVRVLGSVIRLFERCRTLGRVGVA